MDNNWAIMLLAFGFAGLICIFIAVVLVALIIIFFRQTRSTAKQFSYRPSKQSKEFLASAALRPWGYDGWTDLSSYWEGWWLNRISISRSDGYAQVSLCHIKIPRIPAGSPLTSNIIRPEVARSSLKPASSRSN